MVGRHLIKAWLATQASLALSSGEAEYYGVVRGVGIGMGLQALYRDVGLVLPLRVWTDSTAAIGTAAVVIDSKEVRPRLLSGHEHEDMRSCSSQQTACKSA